MMLNKTAILVLLLAVMTVRSAPKREIITKVANKLNQILPHFSKVLEIGINENNELGIYAREDLKQDSEVMRVNSDYVLPSFEEYYRTYYFTELITGTQHDSLSGRMFIEMFAPHLTEEDEGTLALERNQIIKAIYRDLLQRTGQYKRNWRYWKQYEIQELENREAYRMYQRYMQMNKDEFIQKKITQMIKNQKDWPDGPEPLSEQMEVALNRQNLLWVHAFVGYYSRYLTRFQFFKLRNIKKNKYERIVPASYEPVEQQRQDKLGQGMLPFIDLIRHCNHKPDHTLTLDQALAKSKDYVNTKAYKLYLQQQGYNVNDPVPRSKSFDDLNIYDSLYFLNLETEAIYDGKLSYGYNHVTLRANRDYRAGEELTYSIGPYLNYQLLSEQGIVLRNNPNEFFQIFPKNQPTDEWKALLRRHFIFFSSPDDDKEARDSKDTFKFHINQINHRFMQYMRSTIFQFYMTNINEEIVDAVFQRQKFNNPFWETMAWFNYQQSIDQRAGFKSQMGDDLEELEERQEQLAEKPGDLSLERKVLFTKLSVESKKLTVRHLAYSRHKTAQGFFGILFNGFVKDQFVENTGEIKRLRKIKILSKWRRQQNWSQEVDAV